MDKLIDFINLKMKLNVKGVDGKDVFDPKNTFAKRAALHYVFRYGNKLNWFYNSVQDLA
jgi:hypothetical protein